ncbi:MAG: phytoene/squalene synthase family protein [Chloroflexota bacterium]
MAATDEMVATAAPGRDPAVAALLPEARETIRQVARTFALAARLLPRDVREDTELLYLVLRTLDDLVDLEGAHETDLDADHDTDERLAAVEAWAARRAPARQTRETRILDDLARRHPALPRDAVADFTAGMRQDLAGPRIRTEADLDAYCYRVAGTVGRLMAAVLGAHGPDADRAARSLGIAMQRTNILRDVDEDLARGRVYIPAATLAAHRIPVDGLATADRRALLRDGIARADAAYDEGTAGIVFLTHGRRSIRAAASMYREILRQIERDGLGARRPWRSVVPRRRKAALVARALLRPGGRIVSRNGR